MVTLPARRPRDAIAAIPAGIFDHTWSFVEWRE
jgi:hypothetical protein